VPDLDPAPEPDLPDAQPTEPRVELAFGGTCDLAVWCKVLRDRGWSGARIARGLGRSEGYINNLIRVVDRASPTVMVRWREEQGGVEGVCATDWLVQICMLPHDRQDEELARRIANTRGLRERAPSREVDRGSEVEGP